ncbi:outer membrane protein assembly factor BamA [Luteolibacter ambystomatis]|uniref:Outer membrane protein assembly factor BamA n=1 Tax=Luteolibacter ambystomatis TaxID=2824561 RepID=A0A975G7J7_9BACT|nr:outer membrane protein assembly factor BamA [Luteolibacter ambystomatis]QUE49750.1 outer membrane protein assembly factor BamA [Luteolibacter ambystomatis]
MSSSHSSGLQRAARSARMVLPLTFAAAALSTTALRAQDFEGKTISEVSIRYVGPKTVDEARIRNSMSSAAGQQYRTEKIDSDIKSLYGSGLVEDVRFLAEPQGDRVKLIAEVRTRSTVSGVGFVGNSTFSDAKLAKETKLKSGGILSDAAIVEAKRNLEKYYQGYGYPDVAISYRTQPSAGGADLIFVIDEGSKNEIHKIRFEGNTAFTDAELRKNMKTKPKGLLSFLTKSGRFETGKLDEDVESVLDFYRSHGYLRVSSPGLRRDPAGNDKVDIVIPIVEGDKYTVAGVGFGHMSVFKPEELYPALTLNGGDAYSSKKMRADITMIRSYYGSRGYADATVVPDISDAGPNQVKIIYRITEGSRFRVGDVHIEGNTKTKDKVIRREVPLKPGQWFNSVDLDVTKSRLQNLQYFSDVQVNGNSGSNAGYRDVNILVEEKKTGSVGVGVGFSSIDSIVGFINLEQTNFDLFNPWSFTGGGQRFGMNLRLGSTRTDFSLSLVEPWFMDRQLSLGGELFYRDSNYFSDFYDQKNVGASIFLRRPLGEKGAVKVEYKLEQVSVDLDPSVAVLSNKSVLAGGPPSQFLLDQGDFIRSALTAEYVYDSRDSNLLARSGEKLSASVTLAGLGGDVDIVSTSFQGQKYWNLWGDSILSLNGELAFVDALSGRVPIFDRMFLGGGRTLRGFEFRDVGPRDAATGEVIGGRSLAYLDTEYTIPIIENVRAAVFYDMGFVNSGSWDLDPSDIYSDVGIGIRLKLPISPLPLALDYAIPLQVPDQKADNGGQFNFSLQYQY